MAAASGFTINPTPFSFPSTVRSPSLAKSALKGFTSDIFTTEGMLWVGKVVYAIVTEY